VVRGRVTVGDQLFRDGDLSLEELVDRYHEGVATAGPSPGDFMEVLEGIPGEVLLPSVSLSLSSTTLHSAQLAASMAGARVRVLDTGTSAGGLALVAIHAARAARAGGTLDEVERAARQAMAGVRLVVQVGTLEYLIRSGRLPASVGRVASRLGMRPIIELRRGRLSKRLPALSKPAADDRMIEMWRRSRREGARLHVAAMHVLAEEDGLALLDRVKAEVEPATELVTRFGAIMVAHTGPVLTGLAWWWEQAPDSQA
jgi:DegV family protein with EDD domain